MNKNLNCQQLTDAINAIKSKKSDFDEEFQLSNFATSVKLIKEISTMIDKAENQIWTLEILTKENLAEQYDGWTEMYQDLNPEYKLPSIERIFDFLKKDREFIKLMEIKEKQGFTKMIISPAPGHFTLKDFLTKIEHKIISSDGRKNNFSVTYDDLLKEDDKVRYFGTIDNRTLRPRRGISVEQISQNPDEHSICDGWMISFTTNEHNIARREIEKMNGRAPVITGLTALGYQNKYFSNNNNYYKNEEPMIPQEFFAEFAEDLYNKYVKINKKITVDTDDLLGSKSVNWFISTYSLNAKVLQTARWKKLDRELYCYAYNTNFSHESLGVRSVMRRNLKHHE